MREKIVVNTRELAEILGISQTRTKELKLKGILEAEKVDNRLQFDLEKAAGQYRAYREALEDKQKCGHWETEKLKEEIRYKKAKADIVARELSELDAQLHKAEVVQALFCVMKADFITKMLETPDRIGEKLSDLDDGSWSIPVICELIKNVLAEAMEEIAAHDYSSEDYVARYQQIK